MVMGLDDAVAKIVAEAHDLRHHEMGEMPPNSTPPENLLALAWEQALILKWQQYYDTADKDTKARYDIAKAKARAHHENIDRMVKGNRAPPQVHGLICDHCHERHEVIDLLTMFGDARPLWTYYYE
jgi:hypothetical protein